MKTTLIRFVMKLSLYLENTYSLFDISGNLQDITKFQSLDRVEGDANSNNLATLNTYPTFQQEEEECFNHPITRSWAATALKLDEFPEFFVHIRIRRPTTNTNEWNFKPTINHL